MRTDGSEKTKRLQAQSDTGRPHLLNDYDLKEMRTTLESQATGTRLPRALTTKGFVVGDMQLPGKQISKQQSLLVLQLLPIATHLHIS